ncbi:MAG: DNA primase [Acidobacteriota bacterium]
MDVTDQIRQTANIVEMASLYTTLRKRGSKHVGLCPFHSEKDGSFTVDEDKQLYHCFGCGAGGDIFTLVMEKEDLTFPESVKFLAEKYNIPLPEQKRRSPKEKKIEEDLFLACESAMAFFKKNLFNTKEGEEAMRYLSKRSIPEDVIQELKIGYALNSWDALLTSFQEKGLSTFILEKAGLILKRQNKEGHYDRFRGRIIFPIFNLTGKVVAFGGRTIIDDDPKYLNSPDTPIYTKGKILYGLHLTKQAIREKTFSILVEGYTDFVALYRNGFQNCVASLGTALTSEQMTAVARFAPRMMICYDGDIAGRKAAARAVSLSMEKGVQAKVFTLPEGSDPDSYLEKEGPDRFKDEWKNLTPGLRYLVDYYSSGRKKQIPEEKSKIVRDVVEVLNRIPDPVTRSEYVKQACVLFFVDERTLRGLTKTDKTEKIPEKKKQILFNAEKRLLQIFFADTEVAVETFKELNLQYFAGLASEPIFTVLAEFFQKGKNPDFGSLRDNLDPELLSLLSRVLMEGETGASCEEAQDCLRSIKTLAIEKKLKALGARINELERNGERDSIGPLLKERQVMTEELIAHTRTENTL